MARSFAGDPKQLVALLEGALAHRGTAFLDVISPCVTFNNHEGSTKSYKYAKETEELLHEVSFIPFFEQISVDYEEGATKSVELHDGSHITLRKLGRDFDPRNLVEALRVLHESREKEEFVTGLLYVDPKKPDFTELLDMPDEPLAQLPAEHHPPVPCRAGGNHGLRSADANRQDPCGKTVPAAFVPLKAAVVAEVEFDAVILLAQQGNHMLEVIAGRG